MYSVWKYTGRCGWFVELEEKWAREGKGEEEGEQEEEEEDGKEDDDEQEEEEEEKGEEKDDDDDDDDDDEKRNGENVLRAAEGRFEAKEDNAFIFLS